MYKGHTNNCAHTHIHTDTHMTSLLARLVVVCDRDVDDVRECSIHIFVETTV